MRFATSAHLERTVTLRGKVVIREKQKQILIVYFNRSRAEHFHDTYPRLA